MSKLPHKRPCASCPYRRDVPSGMWDESEYTKLPQYDGDIVNQIENNGHGTFGCHQANDCLCAGWVGHRDPYDLFALRIAVSNGHVDEAVFDYKTDVPLFSSGQEAHDHGMAEIDAPGVKAEQLIKKILSHVPGVTRGSKAPR